MSGFSREGLLWDNSGIDLEPRWGSDPSLEAIQSACQELLEAPSQDDISVSFMASGALNKLHLIEWKDKKFVFRVTLPIDPRHKTAGEAATLVWLRDHTTIPAPIPIAVDDSSDNRIGHEWIMTTVVPGTSAYYRWRKMSMNAKERLVVKIAEYQAQLFNSAKFRTIGTLKNYRVGPDDEPVPGQLVDLMFCWGQAYDYDVPRGPFRSSHDWLKSLISIITQNKARQLEEAEDEEDKTHARRSLQVVKMLSDLLPRIFPSIQDVPEQTVLYHDDMSLKNIMVGDEGDLTGIVDWECVSAVPLWSATRLPDFLIGVERKEEPCREKYGDATQEEMELLREIHGNDALDCEGKCELYWEHLMEYEQTRLRSLYLTCLDRHCPELRPTVANSKLKGDFYSAVMRCEDGLMLGPVAKWIDAVNKGEFPRLGDLYSELCN